jgi:hypothetical protein
MWISNEEKTYQKIYFIYVIIIQNNVSKVILGQDISFVYPNLEWT